MLLDVNVLVALSTTRHVNHAAATARFMQLDSWATCPTTEAGLLRLLLNERVVGRRATGAEALAQLKQMRSSPKWRFITDQTSLAQPAIDMRVLVGYRQVTDLQLINLAANSGTRLATFDMALCESLAPEDQRWVEFWGA